MEGGRFATFVSPVALSSSQTSHTTPVSTRGATTCVSPTEQPQLLLGHWDLSHTVRQAGPQLQQCSDRGHYPRDSPLTHPEPGETPWRWIKLHHKLLEDSRTSLWNPLTTRRKKIRVWHRFCLQTTRETFKQQRHHQQKSGSRSWKANSWCKMLLILHALSSKIGQNSQGTSFPFTPTDDLVCLHQVCWRRKEICKKAYAVTDPFVKVKPHIFQNHKRISHVMI